MALVLTVDTEFNNPDAPYLTFIDPIESKEGSVYLWDASKIDTAIWSETTSGFGNLLLEYGEQTTGLSPDFNRGIVGTNVVAQKTAKGGMHLIVANAVSHSDRIYLTSNDDLTTYLNDELNKSGANFYISAWRKFTRKASANSPISTMLINTSDFTLHEQTDLSIRVKSGNAERQPNTSLGSESAVGTPFLSIFNPTSRGATSGRRLIFGTGGLEPFAASNGHPSYILYRIYIEDLAKSGRTYEQVKAIDEAEFAKAFGVGGKFYGDTWNDPSIVLP